MDGKLQDRMLKLQQFQVAILIERRTPPQDRIWLGTRWQVLGIIANSQQSWRTGYTRVRSLPDKQEYLWGGLSIRLHKDEAESYYFNLMAGNPRVFVITTTGEVGIPEPFLVSASFDEAHAYLEAEAEVEAVSMPPEIYRWVEQFVLEHYVPERRIKRKRRNWSKEERFGR